MGTVTITTSQGTFSSGYRIKRMNGDEYVYLTDYQVPPVKVTGDAHSTAEHMLRFATKA